MEIKTSRKKEKLLSISTEGNTFPSWNEMQQITATKIARYGFNPATESGMLSIDQLTNMLQEAEQGPFYTIEEGKKMIKLWREQRKNQ